MIILKIALRNIFRQKRRSILTGLTMTGGFILLSAALSISHGTYDKVINLFTKAYSGHIQIHKKGYIDKPSIYKNFKNIENISSKIENLTGFVSWSPRVFSGALAFLGKKTTAVKMIGIDPLKESLTTSITQKVKEGRYLSSRVSNEMIIAGGLADILKAKLGDEIVLISQGADGSIANDSFKIVGFTSGDVGSAQRINCYVHIEKAQEFLVLEKRYHEISILLSSYELARKTTKTLIEKMGTEELDIKPWQVVQKNFYAAMQADKKGMWIALFIIIIIVALGVLNTVLMEILERTPEYGVLKALGTRPKGVFALIVIETLFLALISVLLGFILSLTVNYLLMKHGYDYPQSVEMGGLIISTMYGSIKPMTFIYPAIITLATSIIVSLIPALRAARIAPIKAIASQ